MYVYKKHPRGAPCNQKIREEKSNTKYSTGATRTCGHHRFVFVFVLSKEVATSCQRSNRSCVIQVAGKYELASYYQLSCLLGCLLKLACTYRLLLVDLF